MNPWLQMLSPSTSIRLPASGDVRMDYSPWTNWGWSASGAGNPAIEHEIFTTVALPGRQLGKLTDVVTTLLEFAEQSHPGLAEGDSKRAIDVREFKQMVEEIQNRKQAIEKSAEEAAENALLRLKNVDAKAHRRLIERELASDSQGHSTESPESSGPSSAG